MGYEKITLTPGFNMLGNQFSIVGGNSFHNINEMFKDSSQLVAGADDSSADSILTWDGSSYSSIYYFDEFDNNWYNGENLEAPTTDTITAGQGFWFKHVGTETISTTFAGEVPTNATISVTITTGFNFIANPYPVAIGPNSNYFSVEGAVSGADDSEADSILTWDGSSYNNVYYFDSFDDNWYNGENLEAPVSEAIFKPLMGFWYRHKGSGGTLTFTKPY